MYRLTNDDIVIRLADNACIPADEGNADFRAYRNWIAAGNSPEAFVSPVVVPSSVTRFQARAALHRAGLLVTVNALMASPEVDPEAALAWSDAQEFMRTSPTLISMAAALGLTEAQLDDLFITAAGIEA